MRPILLVALLSLLGGCDQLGIESTTAVAARRDAEGRAVGAGCRQAARSVEHGYDLNKRADKAAVYAGWRDMNDYMRENQLQAQPPAPESEAVEVAAADGDADKAKAAKPAKTAKR